MQEPHVAKYLQAAHQLARGRDHRFSYASAPEIVRDEFGRVRGAWVKLEVWITEAEAAAHATPPERPESPR